MVYQGNPINVLLMNKSFKYLISFVFLVIVASSFYLFSPKGGKELHLIACDVGEGDAIIAVYGQTQVLIDGGPGNQVLECLGEYMPFWDREIELVVLTHPESDHYTGLIGVFKRYKVDNFLTLAAQVSSPAYSLLESLVGGGKTRVIFARGGMVIRLGLLSFDIVNPIGDNNLEKITENNGFNDYSIAGILSLGKFKALLTGDISPSSEKDLYYLGKLSKVNYIKIPHHGSKNGLVEEVLKSTMPDLAVISVGENQWGHPDIETLNLLAKYNIRTLRTDEKGNIEIRTDGKIWMVME
jgi:competence protein ComEC